VQYTNLNSLGRAYRAGNVDRSTYIRQRRALIDAFTLGPPGDSQDLTATVEVDAFDEMPTVISHIEELHDGQPAAEKTNVTGHRRFLTSLSIVVIIILIVTAFAVFQ
jgi:hypothetical protein